MGADSIVGYSGKIYRPCASAGRSRWISRASTCRPRSSSSTTTLREVFAERVSGLIVEEAAARRAELIVVGTHGRRGVVRMRLGSDAEQVARSANVPVLRVRGT